MSSFRKAIPRREHKERSQPEARQHMGLLEKKKDYILRARDYHAKSDAIKKLKEKAAFRNKDEFYFGMVNTKTVKGVHVMERNEKFDHETILLMNSQDSSYIQLQRSMNLSKIEGLSKNIHLAEDNDNAVNHTIFVDSKKDFQNFSVAEHFDTIPEMETRTTNRLRKEQLSTIELQTHNSDERETLSKGRTRDIYELEGRIDRENNLRKAQLEMQLRRNLMGKGAKKKIKVDSRGLAVYKWQSRRSK